MNDMEKINQEFNDFYWDVLKAANPELIITQKEADQIVEFFEQKLNIHSVSGSLQAEAIKFAEWIRTFDALDKKHGFWVIERQLSSEELHCYYLRDRESWRNDR